MIYDRIDNWRHLHLKPSPCLEKAFQFLSHLNPDCELGEYPLIGHSMFARVMEYETRPAEEAICESHKKFVDLQATIRGFEDIEWFHASELKIQQPYQDDKDAIFYEKPDQPLLRMTMAPGHFTLLFPSDAHSPGITSSQSDSPMVKKLVIKIDLDFLLNGQSD